jgi:hypothetical protein
MICITALHAYSYINILSVEVGERREKDDKSGRERREREWRRREEGEREK